MNAGSVSTNLRRLAKASIVSLLGGGPSPRQIVAGLGRGLRLNIDPAEDLGVLIGVRERPLQKTLRRHLRPGGVVFDIGANIGLFTLMASRLVGPTGRVYAFEPVPQTMARLRENLDLNAARNVMTRPHALADRHGRTTFRIPEAGGNHSMASMMWHRTDTGVRELEVDLVKADDDDELRELKPDFVKIDAEGAEGLVVSGMAGILRRARPIVFIECTELGREETWRILGELAYECRSTDGRRIDEFSAYRHDNFVWSPIG